MITRATILFVINLFVCILFSEPLLAQLSPGELHQSHAFLEGLTNCTQCHAAGKRVSRDKCLDCHILLKNLIKMARGLHSHPDYKNCIDCHTDHHGRKFELIHWKNGQKNFDHSLTGYDLVGGHAKIECQSCHKPQNIVTKVALLKQKKDLKRTFMGLPQDCLSCHHDEHRGQLSFDCQTCHNLEAWKPAPEFDHGKTRYRLTGKHKKVLCKKCHETVVDMRFLDDSSFLKFPLSKFGKCLDCHQDVHKGRFSKVCTSCHSTAGWDKIIKGRFNHDKTRYPLKGRHKKIACKSCHKPGKRRRGLKYASCRNCHSDFHKGQFSRRSSKGACEECHTVKSFTPSTFTIKDHQKGRYKLQGGHLAIPCIACHSGGPRGARKRRSMLRVNRFTFQSLRCQNCHKNPHSREVNKYIEAGGCEHCHHVDSWSKNQFDHNQTKFVLKGKHVSITCVSCHKRTDHNKTRVRIAFLKLPVKCQDCHKDNHHGQFDKRQRVGRKTVFITDCRRCHTAKHWKADKFDHNRQSTFSLKGAHEKVPCKSCHYDIVRNGQKYPLYKPLSNKCVSCHAKNML